MSEKGIERSAILLMTLGEEGAAEVFKYLSPKEVQTLGMAMATLQNVTRSKVNEVLTDFRQDAAGQTGFGGDSSEYIRTVLTKALGSDRAANLIERILHDGDTAGVERLKWMDAGAVAEMIKNEHPQIIATILVHLDRDQASEVLGLLGERLRNDVILRIATLDGIQPTALKDLNEVLSKLLTGSSDSIKNAAMGGTRVAAEILNFMPASLETSMIATVRDFDPQIAQKIQSEMFAFDHLDILDDRAIQLLLREVPSESLIVALKGATEELREKIFKNLSTRAAEMLREDLAAKGPVRVSEVEAKQAEILMTVRRLADEGLISLGGKREHAVV